MFEPPLAIDHCCPSDEHCLCPWVFEWQSAESDAGVKCQAMQSLGDAVCRRLLSVLWVCAVHSRTLVLRGPLFVPRWRSPPPRLASSTRQIRDPYALEFLRSFASSASNAQFHLACRVVTSYS